MDEDGGPESLTELLDRMAAAHTESDGGDEKVTVDAVLDAVGRRSFGPLLLVAGLVTLAPVVGDIPGVPTLMGVLVFLVAAQLLLGREHLWFPGWLLRRSVQRDRLTKGIEWLRRPAAWADRVTRPRMERLVHDAGVRVIAVACVVIGAGMPPMEVVPFSANGAGAALTVFGLSLISLDGLLALAALLITSATAGVVVYSLL